MFLVQPNLLPSNPAKNTIGIETSWPSLQPIPEGWLECDGSAISRTVYSDLFNVLGTLWGSGDGSTTFNLPDRRGVILKGSGNSTQFREIFEAIRFIGAPLTVQSVATDTITTTTNHGLAVGDMVFLYGGSSNATSDRLGIGYVTAIPLTNTVKISATLGGTAYATYTNTGVIKIAKVAKSSIPATTVLSGNNFTAPLHGLKNGDILYMANGMTPVPTGITVGDQYRVTVVDTNTFTLTSTKLGALVSTGGSVGGIFYKLSQDVGTWQLDTLQGHWHYYQNRAVSGSGGGIGQSSGAVSFTNQTIDGGGPAPDGTDGTPRISSETRPLNQLTRYIIRYKEITVSGFGSNSSGVATIGNIHYDPTGSAGSTNWSDSAGGATVETVANGLTGFATELKISASGAGSIIETIAVPTQLRGESLQIRFEGYVQTGPVTIQILRADGITTLPATIPTLPSSGSANVLISLYGAGESTFKIKISGTGAFDFRRTNIYVGRAIDIYGSTVGPWQSYTPVFSAGLGTVTGIAMKYRDVPEGIEITGEFTTGTVSASVATMSLPSGKTSMSDYPAYEMVGTIKRNVANSNTRNAIINASNSVISMSLDNNASAGQLTPTNGDVLFGSSERVSVGIIYIRTSQAQGRGVVQLAESNAPLYLSNITPTVRSSVAGQTIEPSTGMNYYGVDGAPILGHSNSIVYYDIDLPRALLPNEVPHFEVRSKIDGTWMKIEDARAWIAGAGAFGMRLWDWLPTTTTGRTYGCGLVQSPNAGKLRVKFSGSAINSFSSETLQSDTATSGAIGWATVASTYFDRWRVRIGPQNAVELPPTVYAHYFKSGGGFMTSAGKITDTHSLFNGSNEWVVPMAGVYNFSNYVLAGDASSWTAGAISVNGTTITDSYSTPTSGNPSKISCSAPFLCAKGDLIKFNASGTNVSSQRVNIARLGPK